MTTFVNFCYRNVRVNHVLLKTRMQPFWVINGELRCTNYAKWATAITERACDAERLAKHGYQVILLKPDTPVLFDTYHLTIPGEVKGM